jgi:hypothetical protein
MLQHVLVMKQLKYGLYHFHQNGLLLEHIQKIHHLFMHWNGWTMIRWLLVHTIRQ